MITKVAIRNDNVIISLPKPNRHADCFAYAEKLGINVLESVIGIKAIDQGFLTDKGIFLDRMQTAKHLKRVKQQTVVPIGTIAISEDLW